jgi:hypothetical protein
LATNQITHFVVLKKQLNPFSPSSHFQTRCSGFYNKSSLFTMPRRQPDETIPRYAASSDEKRRSKSCCCCCFALLIVILIIIAGALLIWKLLPQGQKSGISNIVASGASGLVSGSGVNASLIGLGTPPTFNYYRCKSDKNCCNGVETICDKKVTQVMFAGLHNAYCTIQDGFLLAGNQEYDLESALQAGFRAINVDLGVCGSDFALIHDKCELGRRDPYTVFSHINLFLDKHPREVLLIPIEVNNNADGPVNLWDFYALLQSVGNFTARMYVHKETNAWPTMRQLINNDKRVIMFVYNANVSCRTKGNCPPGIHDWFLYASETIYTFPAVADLQTTKSACPYDRGSQGYRDFYALNMFVTNPLPSKSSALVINQPAFLQKHVKACESVVKRNASVIFIDFWDEGDLVDVVQSQNQML